MKKIICLLLAVLMLATLAACGGKKQDSDKDAEPAPDGKVKAWDRDGYFQDDDGHFVSITWMEDVDEPGWYVGVALSDDWNEDSYGGMAKQEGVALKGTLPSGGDKGDITVTVTEEGEDGIILAIDGGETYHLKKMEIPEAAFTVTINTEGLGQIAYAEEGEAIDFEGERYTSAYIGLEGPKTYTIAAYAPDVDWEFVKWTLNGKDYTTEPFFTVEITEDCDFIAVFEFVDSDVDGNPVSLYAANYESDRASAKVEADGTENARITIEWGSSAWSLGRWVMTGKFDEATRTVNYSDCVSTVVTYSDDGTIVSEDIEYENGTGSIVFDGMGKFTWKDDQSDREDLVFEWVSELADDDEYYSPVTAMEKGSVESLAAVIKSAYLTENWEMLADYINLPINVSGTKLKSASEFIAFMSDKTLYEEDRAAMEQEPCRNMFVNGQGICMGSGQIWLNDPNYMTDEAPELLIIAISGYTEK